MLSHIGYSPFVLVKAVRELTGDTRIRNNHHKKFKGHLGLCEKGY
jgi:hypothetical protein